jgi:hypothetical protein
MFGNFAKIGRAAANFQLKLVSAFIGQNKELFFMHVGSKLKTV